MALNETAKEEEPVSSAASSASTASLEYCKIGVCAAGCAFNAFQLACQLRKYPRKTPRNPTTALLINQFALDLVSCALVVLCAALKTSSIDLSAVGETGSWLCTIFYSSFIARMALTGSLANQAVIAVHLRFEVRWGTSYKRLLRLRMVCIAAALCWIYGILLNAPMTFYAYLQNGDCVTMNIRATPVGQVAFGTFAFILKYLLPSVVLVVSYSVMFFVHRRGSYLTYENGDHRPIGVATATAYSPPPKTVEVMKTMALLAVYAVLAWAPSSVVYLVAVVDDRQLEFRGFQSIATVVGLVNVATSPVVHAVCEGDCWNQLAAIVRKRKGKTGEEGGGGDVNMAHEGGSSQPTDIAIDFVIMI